MLGGRHQESLSGQPQRDISKSDGTVSTSICNIMKGSVSASSPYEKKKLAPSNIRPDVLSGTVCAVGGFPIPTNPFS